jgi:hypothetical protein
MRIKFGSAAALVCAVALVAPSAASAECDTAVNCAIERVDTTVDETIALVQRTVDDARRKVDETKAFVDQTVEQTKALALQTLADAQWRAGAGEHVCVLQGRYYAATGTVSGTSDCSHRSRDWAYTEAAEVHHGTFSASNVALGRSQTATWLEFNDGLVIVNDAGGAGINPLTMRSTALGAAVYTGRYGGAGPADTVAAALTLLGASGLDPDADPNDAFVQGAVVMEGLA